MDRKDGFWSEKAAWGSELEAKLEKGRKFVDLRTERGSKGKILDED